MKKIIFVLGASLLVPLAAAAGPSYNYVQGSYIVDGELNALGGSADFDGWSAKASGAILPNLFLQGAHAQVNPDGTSEDENLSSIAVGANAPVPLQGPSALDLFGTVSYELLNGPIDADGVGIDLGLRFLPVEQFEISPFVGYVNYGQIKNVPGPDVDLDGLRYGVEALVHVIPCLALTASYRQTKLNADVSGGGSGDVDLDDEVRVGLRLEL